MNITSITNIEDKKKIAILDTSSISFLQYLNKKCSSADIILKRWILIRITVFSFPHMDNMPCQDNGSLNNRFGSLKDNLGSLSNEISTDHGSLN